MQGTVGHHAESELRLLVCAASFGGFERSDFDTSRCAPLDVDATWIVQKVRRVRALR